MCRQLPEKNIFNAQHFLFFELHALRVMELRATNQFAYVNKHNFIASDMKIIKIKQQQISNNTARIFIITPKFKSVKENLSKFQLSRFMTYSLGTDGQGNLINGLTRNIFLDTEPTQKILSLLCNTKINI